MARYSISSLLYQTLGEVVFTDALAAIAADGGGYLDVLDPGTYELTCPLVLPANTVLTVGPGVVLKRVGGLYLVRNASSGHTNYGAPGNIHVRGEGVLDVNAHGMTGSDGASGITLVQCENVSVTGVTITGIRNWHAIEYQSVRRGTIRDVTATGFTASGGGWWAAEAFQLDLSPTDYSPCEDIIVDGCKSVGYGKLLGSHSSRNGKAMSRIRVVNNLAENCHSYAVGGENWRYVTVANNTFMNCNGAVRMHIPALDDGGDPFTTHNKGFTITGNSGGGIGSQNECSSKMPAGIDILSESTVKHYGVTVMENSLSGSNSVGVRTVKASVYNVSSNNLWDGFTTPYSHT